MMASAQQAHVRAALAPQPIHDMMQIEMPPALRASVYLTLPTADRADALAQCAPVGRAQIEAAIPQPTREEQREQEHSRVIHAPAHVTTQYTAGTADAVTATVNRWSAGVRLTLVIGLCFR